MREKEGIKLCVLTRTNDRPLFLKRCFACLQKAMPDDGQWLIIDDSMNAVSSMEELIADFQKQVRWSICYIHSGQQHRTKALNIGLEQAQGDYFHILDDDDLVSADFYKTMLTFLERDKAKQWGAVACLCERVDEKVKDGAIIELSRRPHYPELSYITFATLAMTMKTPTCSLLFRRDVIDTMRFDEDFHVAEDHEFLLRFLIRADIAVLRQKMASFHQRDDGSNSEITHNFVVESARFRNMLMRRDLSTGEMGLGWLITLAEMNKGAMRFDLILTKLYRYKPLQWLFSKIRN